MDLVKNDEGLKTLLDSGREKGYLTYSQVNEYLPDDAVKVYEHVHTKCSTLQYQSKKLAQQLGPDDNDGRAAIVFESQTPSYNAAAVNLILIDVLDSLGADAKGC